MLQQIYFAIPGDINQLTGGYGYDRRLLAELIELGCQVRHLALPTPGFDALAPSLNSEPAALHAPVNEVLLTINNLFAQLPDGAVVIIDGLVYAFMAEIAEQQRHRLRLIALCHHPLACETGLAEDHRRTLVAMERRALAAASAILVTSANTQRILTDGYAVPLTHITVALPGTDPQHYAPCSGNPPVLLTVATFTRRKAHDILLAALAQITDLPWHARWVGSDTFDRPWATRLRLEIIRLGLDDRITWLGNLADLTDVYTQADMFVLPSLFEGYGMVFAEALSFGLPVVAGRTSAVADLIPPSAGILVAPGDAQALADSLSQLLSHAVTRQQLQIGARNFASTLPRWTQTASVVHQLIQQVIKQ